MIKQNEIVVSGTSQSGFVSTAGELSFQFDCVCVGMCGLDFFDAKAEITIWELAE